MDKKTIIGLLLIGVILFGYSWYNSNVQKKYVRQMEIADSIDRAKYPEKYVVEQTPTDSVSLVISEADTTLTAKAEAEHNAKVDNLGQMLVDAQQGEEKIYTLENDVIKVTVSSLGAKITNVELKDYKRYDKQNNGQNVMMFAPGSEKFDLCFYLKKNYNYAQVNTADYYFTSTAPEVLVAGEGSDQQTLSMKLPVDENSYIEFLYTIRQGDYMLDYNVRFVGMKEWVSNLTDFTIDWQNASLQNEKGYKNENMYTTISYLYPDSKSVDDLGMGDAKRGGGIRSESVNSKIDWFAFKQQFFSSVFICKDKFQNAELKYTTYADGVGRIKDFSALVSVPFSANQSDYAFNFYFGPNKFSVLKSYDLGLEKLVPLGGWMVRWVNRLVVIPTFDFLSRYIGSFGLIILLLTIFIKLIILPLTYKSYMSSAKMRVLKPEVDEISAKYPKQEDALKKQQAVMALYKSCGASPMGGCLPMLIQFPILIAMFRFFPASIELRGERFLWAEDLSSYDSIFNLPFDIPWYGSHVSLFALIMAVTLFFYSKLNYEQTAATGGGQQIAGMKFMMVYMMPVMMLLWFNNYASGLCYYYFLSQIITIGQTTGFRYLVNEEKLHEKLKAVASNKKPSKKSNWQKRLEEMQRKQLEMQRQQQKRR